MKRETQLSQEEYFVKIAKRKAYKQMAKFLGYPRKELTTLYDYVYSTTLLESMTPKELERPF